MFRSYFRESRFWHIKIILWKSDEPLVKVLGILEASGTTSDKKIKTTKIHQLVLLKQAFCCTKFLELLLNRNSDIIGSVSSMLKYAASSNLSKVCL